MGLQKAHRVTQRKGARFYVRWRAWRDAGAPSIGIYSGASWAECEALEKADEAARAGRYAEAHIQTPNTDMLGGLLDNYELSGEFTKCSPSTQDERRRVIKSMKTDRLEQNEREIELQALPVLALGSKRARAIFKAWRDTQAKARGARDADYRVQVLRRALRIAVDDGLAPANPLTRVAEVWTADRSELIWETQHQAAYFGWIDAERRRVNTLPESTDALKHNKRRQLARLQAGEDALVIALHTGKRREDLAAFTERELRDDAIVYEPRKGARRARTAGETPRVCVVPILPPVKAVLDQRRGYGWIIRNSRGAPYTPGALGAIVNEIASAAGVERTLHDAKGTFVTMLREAGFAAREIAEMVDWSEDDVERICRRYCSQSRVVAAWVERLRKRNG